MAWHWRKLILNDSRKYKETRPILKCDDERIELGAPNLMGSSCTAFPATVTIYSNLTSTIITPARADYELPSIISAKRSKRARLSRVLHRLHVILYLTFTRAMVAPQKSDVTMSGLCHIFFSVPWSTRWPIISYYIKQSFPHHSSLSTLDSVFMEQILTHN